MSKFESEKILQTNWKIISRSKMWLLRKKTKVSSIWLIYYKRLFCRSLENTPAKFPNSINLLSYIIKYSIVENPKKKHWHIRFILFIGVNDRSSYQRCSIKKGALRNFTKFTRKYLRQILFFNKVAGLERNF